jgi:hypothetical protein
LLVRDFADIVIAWSVSDGNRSSSCTFRTEQFLCMWLGYSLRLFVHLGVGKWVAWAVVSQPLQVTDTAFEDMTVVECGFGG